MAWILGLCFVVIPLIAVTHDTNSECNRRRPSRIPMGMARMRKILKSICFVFDLAPTRALLQLSECGIGRSPNEPNPENPVTRCAHMSNRQGRSSISALLPRPAAASANFRLQQGH
jgi:hypothetical protein